MKTLYLAALSILLISACAQTPESPESLEGRLAESELELGNIMETIPHFAFDSWEYLDKYHMIVKTRGDSHYLISFSHRCNSFSKSSVPIFEYRGSSLSKFDIIKIAQPSGTDLLGRFAESCPIKDIVKLNAIAHDAVEE